MKLLWAFDAYSTGGGNGYSLHRKKLKEALIAAGVNVTLDREDSFDLAVHVIRPDYFDPIPGKRNLCFSTCEMTRPTVMLSAIPDVLVVPCKHNRQVFGECYPGLPIRVCPEGVDGERFPYTERRHPGPEGIFRYLYFGNDFHGQRKGAPFALHAFMEWHKTGRMPERCEMYFKTTQFPGPALQYHYFYNGELFGPLPAPVPGPGARQAVIFDTRHLPLSELRELYNGAHAFIFPTCGEGWGLTLTEAMATGLPAAWTDYSAMRDYADASIGYPLPFHMCPFWKPGRELGVGEPDYFGAAAEEEAIIGAMESMYHDYPSALARGKAASERMHSRYTWSNAAARFIEICKEYT